MAALRTYKMVTTQEAFKVGPEISVLP